MKNKYRYLFTSIFVITGFLLTAGLTHAATIYANSSTGDDTTGDGSSETPYKTFHKAYTEASADDTIDLTGTFTWTDADETGDAATSGYTIGKNITIAGQGADQTIVQSASSENTADRRVFTISNGVTAAIEDLTIRYGVSGSSDGAGIHVEGIATIEACTVSYNRSTGGSGGGINVRGSATVQNSTIHNNVAHYKGGGLNRAYYSGTGGEPGASDTLDIINSTIAFNQVTQTVAYLEGGGVFFRRGSGSITNSTIAYNQVVNGGTSRSTHGVGTGDASSIVYLKNNIIAGNYLSTYGGDIGHRSSSNGSFVDNGGNIIGRPGYYSVWTPAATTWIDAATYTTAIDGTYAKGEDTGSLNLDTSLANNDTTLGTQTLAITEETSIAVDNGITGVNNNVDVPTTDQRDVSRGATVGIGAYEVLVDNTAPTVSAASPTSGATGVDADATFVLTFDEDIVTSTGNIILYKTSDDSLIETIDITSGLVTASGTTALVIDPDTTLGSSIEYYWMMDATAVDDSNGNSFAGITASTTWTFTTADIVAPTLSGASPSGEQEASTTSVTLSITTDENATCKYDTSSGTAYASMTAFTSTGATTHTSSITVESGQSYAYYILCQDSSSNESSEGSISFSIAQSGGGAAPSLPPAVGSGDTSVSVPMGSTGDVGAVSDAGTNVMTYIHTPVNFQTTVSAGSVQTHQIEIIEFDLASNILTLEIRSEPQQLTLKLDEHGMVDLDGDGVSDVKIKFENVYVNRAELTITEVDDVVEVPVVEDVVIEEKTVATSYNFTRDLKLGMTGEDVKELQRYLNSNGYTVADTGYGSAGNETQYFGPATQAALIRFQQDHDLPAYGYFGALTRVVVQSDEVQIAEKVVEQKVQEIKQDAQFTRDLFLGMWGEDVRALQQYLNRHNHTVADTGYGSAGYETQYFGPATERALIQFQEARGLPAYGYFGSMTRAIVK